MNSEMKKSATKTGEGRWVVLDSLKGVRLGEIFGGNGQYQAQTMRGAFVGNTSTLSSAAALLIGS